MKQLFILIAIFATIIFQSCVPKCGEGHSGNGFIVLHFPVGKSDTIISRFDNYWLGSGCLYGSSGFQIKGTVVACGLSYFEVLKERIR